MNVHRLGCGAGCRFYHMGDIQQPPTAAIVLSDNGKGSLKLWVYPFNGGMPRLARGAVHVSTMKPGTREHERAIQEGAWDYVEGQEPKWYTRELEMAAKMAATQ